MTGFYRTAARTAPGPNSFSAKTRSTFRTATLVRTSAFLEGTTSSDATCPANEGQDWRRSAMTKSERAFELACDLGLKPRCPLIHSIYDSGACKTIHHNFKSAA